MKKIKKVIIPVAGLGSRFLPTTKSIAKEMFPIVDTPALLLILEECLDSGISDVFFVTRRGKEYIKDFFSHDKEFEEKMIKANRFDMLKRLNRVIDSMNITYDYQKPEYNGTAGACYIAKEWANNEPFAVVYSDDLNYTPKGERPAIGQLIDAYNETGAMIIGCKEVFGKEISSYGACKIEKKIDDRLYKISGIVEKPKYGTEPSKIAGLARYVMPANTFDYIEKQIRSTPFGKEMNLTDTMDMIMKDQPAYALIMDSVRYDTGDKLGFLIATVEYGMRDEKLGADFKNYLKNLKID